MVATIKRRSNTFVRGKYLNTVWGMSGPGPIAPFENKTYQDYCIRGEEETLSENHPGWNTRRKLLADPGKISPHVREGIVKFLHDRDIGGPFTNTKNRYEGSHDENIVRHSFGPSPGEQGRLYQGPLFAYAGVGPAGYTNPAWFPTVQPFTHAQMVAAGATAIARTIPTNPVVGLATFLGELREGLPKIPAYMLRNRSRDFRDIGSEYLNVEFGWKPFLGEIMDSAEVYRKADEIIAQYSRDSGRHVRRRYDFPPTTVTQVTDMGLRSPVPSLDIRHWKTGKHQGKMTKERKTETRLWFSGCYSYYLDPGIDPSGMIKRNAQLARKLYGLDVTPEVLWNLTPWSWLLDWQTNIGDVMTNVSALSRDGLVIRWGYIMAHTVITDTYTLEGLEFKMGGPGTLKQTFITECKQRLKASPYGFGLTPASFSASQWAILVALGIARAPRQLD